MKNNNLIAKEGLRLLGLFLAVGVGVVQAETVPTTSQAAVPAASSGAQVSTSDVSTVLPGWTKKLTVTYWGNFTGPSLNSPGALSPDTSGNATDPLKLNNHLTLGYKPTTDILIGGVVESNLRLVLGQDMTLKDPYLKVGHGKIFQSGGLKLASDARVYVPVSDASKAVNKSTAVRWNQNLSFDIPNTRFTISNYTFIKNTFYSAENEEVDLELYMAPYANYQMSPKVAATLWVDLFQLTRKRGQTLAEMENAEWDVQPGLNWDITPNVSVNPYLNFYPNKLSVSSSSVGMIIVGKLL